MDFVHYCLARKPQPCTQYRETDREQLDTFLTMCGGQPAQFDADGTAHIMSVVKGQIRSCYAKPGSWVRCLGHGQFSAVSARYFDELYQLVGNPNPLPLIAIAHEPVLKMN
jgi:hypothetical protein